MIFKIIYYVTSENRFHFYDITCKYKDLRKEIQKHGVKYALLEYPYTIMVGGTPLKTWEKRKNRTGPIGRFIIKCLNGKQIGFDSSGNITPFGNKWVFGNSFANKTRLKLSELFNARFPWAQVGSLPHAVARFLNLKGF